MHTKRQPQSGPPAREEPEIEVVHDGIDTQVLAPNTAVSLTLDGNITLTRADEVITSNSSLCGN